MSHRTHLVAGLAGALLVMNSGTAPGAEGPRETARARAYPPAPTADVVDTYHGTRVADPYRPLEDPDAPATRAWIEAENRITFGFLEGIPARERIRRRLTELWDYEKFGVPEQQGGRYFYSRNSGLQNQAVLYAAASLGGDPRVLLDPTTLSPDGTVALGGTAISDDGRSLAYGLAAAGSDWQEWKVRDVMTGRDRADHLKWIKFSTASWTKDGRGFYYGRFPEPKAGEDLRGANYDQKLYYHELGTPQSEDRLVYERPDQKEWQFAGTVTDDGRYLVITVSKGTDDKYRILYQDLEAAAPAPPVELIDHFEHEYSFIDNDGPVFWFKTNQDAPRGRVIAIDTRQPAPAHGREVIPQAAETLESVHLVGDRFIAAYLKDAHSQVKVFDRDGHFEREVELPGLGTATGFGGKRSDRE
ncbi:MAG TPA: S9 family peptidase, partial [Isosphaeraceae bacterium]